MARKPHLFLNNNPGTVQKFALDRNGKSQQPEPKEAAAYRPQKEKLAAAYQLFDSDRNDRLAERTLDIPEHIECIEIDFLIIFGNNDIYQTRTRKKPPSSKIRAFMIA